MSGTDCLLHDGYGVPMQGLREHSVMQLALPSPTISSPASTATDTSTGGSTGVDDDSPFTPDNFHHDHASLQPYSLLVGAPDPVTAIGIPGLGWSGAGVATTTNADANLTDAGVMLANAHKGVEPLVVMGGPSAAPSESSSLRLDGNHWL